MIGPVLCNDIGFHQIKRRLISQRKIIIYWLIYVTINKSKAGWTTSKINLQNYRSKHQKKILMMNKSTGVSTLKRKTNNNIFNVNEDKEIMITVRACSCRYNRCTRVYSGSLWDTSRSPHMHGVLCSMFEVGGRAITLLVTKRVNKIK